MAENADALERGEVDVVQVFEPHADRLVSGGAGHVWHRFSTRGEVAFTSFYTTRRYAAERRGVCLALVRAIAATLDRLHDVPPGETADRIGPAFFPDLPAGALARIVFGLSRRRALAAHAGIAGRRVRAAQGGAPCRGPHHV